MKTYNTIKFAAAVTLLAACTSTIEVNDLKDMTETFSTLTASIETNATTKTSLKEVDEGYDLNWSYGDQIKVYSGNTAVLFETSNSLTTQATFSAVDNAFLPRADKYVAFYPATLDKGNLTLPDKQTWVKNSVIDFPMYAESSTRSLAFSNLCGIIRFRLNLNEAGSSFAVSSITISSEGKGMSGAFSIVNNAAVISSINTDVTLECATAVSLFSSSTTDFNIYVPAGVYNPLKVKIVASDGVERNYESDGAVTVTRSRITSVKFPISTTSSSDGSTETIPITNVEVNFSER